RALQALPPGEVIPVGFRDLWDRATSYRGRAVRVEGRVGRRFRQPAVGRFPPLTELWLTSPQGDPIDLAFATPGPGRDSAEPGDRVRFEGTFLRLVRYAGADGTRLAPLIVGPRPPTRLERGPRATGSAWPDRAGSALDWAFGLAVAAVVVV